jgi:starch phosphorylase
MPPDTAPAAWPGDRDVRVAVDALAARLPDALRDLAAIAFDYGWSWTPDGAPVFSAIDPRRFERVDHNPVRLLRDAPATTLERLAGDEVFLARVRDLAADLAVARARREDHGGLGTVAFLCSEFGVHRSLPCYSGGLGVLAGDILKEASDRALPFVGVGLMYSRGYFHQRVDLSGKQHEYWVPIDPDMLPTVLVTGDDGEPVTVSVRVRGEDVVARIPLYLLDADHEANSIIARWTTSRLYEGNRTIRLAQYALLGVGGIRALRALGIDPSTVHLNEGHPALAALALAKPGDGTRSLEAALATVRDRLVFTTHTRSSHSDGCGRPTRASNPG